MTGYVLRRMSSVVFALRDAREPILTGQLYEAVERIISDTAASQRCPSTSSVMTRGLSNMDICELRDRGFKKYPGMESVFGVIFY